MVTVRYTVWNASFLVWACVQSFVGATVPTWQYDCPEDVSRVIPLSPSALCESGKFFPGPIQHQDLTCSYRRPDGAATNAADGSIATAWGCSVHGSGLNISFDRTYLLKEIMVQSDRPSKRVWFAHYWHICATFFGQIMTLLVFDSLKYTQKKEYLFRS